MTTALNIITRALQDLRVLEEGESPSADQSETGLVYLNDLIQSLNDDGLIFYAKTLDSFTMDGSTSYTWGTSGDFTTERPISINSAYFTLSGVDYPVSIATSEQFEAVSLKTTASSLPDFIYVNFTYPLATVYVYPVPPSGTLNISSWKPLTELATAATVLSVPKGYERMFKLNLAVEMMPSYDRPKNAADQLLIAQAAQARKKLSQLNLLNNPGLTALGLPNMGNRSFNILTG